MDATSDFIKTILNSKVPCIKPMQNVRRREEQIMNVINAHSNEGIGHMQLAAILGIDRGNLTPHMKRLESKGLIWKAPGKQGKYYPISEYKGPIITAVAAGMILENQDFRVNSPFLRNTEDEKLLDLTLFDFSNKIGAIITYLLIQSMNPENKITGNATNDDEKDLNVERWINDAISSLGYVLLPFFKEQIRVPLIMSSLHDNLVDNHDSSIEEKAGLEFLANIRDRPEYMMKQKLISELMGSFSNSYPNIARELKKLISLHCNN